MTFPSTLIPCIPEGSSRYIPYDRVTPAERQILPGMFSSNLQPLPKYETVEWTKSVHPEGAVYFYMTQPKSDGGGPGFDIVTDDFAQDSAKAAQLTKWVEIITGLVRRHKSYICHQGHLELYLKVEDDDICFYYLVDRNAKVILFLEEHSTADLGLECTVSDDHLRQSLERQFWIHTEFFPNHFGGLSKKELDELIRQFRHGSTDQITSNASTFPYESTKCKELVPVLESIREHHLHANKIVNGYDIAIIARLATVVINTRIQTHYGEKISRLDRNTPIIESTDSEVQWTKPLISVLTLGFSDLHLKKLNELYVDTYVYNQLWARRMKECINEWTKAGIAAAFLLAFHGFFLALDVHTALAKTSAGFSAISILSAALLVMRHEPLETTYEGNGYSHLSSIRSEVFGFQGAAFGFAIPRATFLLSLFTFISQGLYLLLKDVELMESLRWIAIVCIVLWVFNLLTSPTQRVLPFWRFRSIRQKAESSVSMA